MDLLCLFDTFALRIHIIFHGNIAALILILFMLQFTYVLRHYCGTHTYCVYATIHLYYRSLCALSSVNASQVSCICTVVNMNKLRVVELLKLDK